MKSTKKHFVLESKEYLVTADDKDGKDYEVYYKGEKINDVLAMVRCVL